MKKLLSLTSLILVILVFSSGCKKGKKNTSDSSQLIIGLWDLVSEHYINYQNGAKVNEDTVLYEKNEASLDFLKNGTMIGYSYGTVSYTGSWEIDGSQLILIHPNHIDHFYPKHCDFTVSKTKLSYTLIEEYGKRGHTSKNVLINEYNRH
jgi:hypothetical protein